MKESLQRDNKKTSLMNRDRDNAAPLNVHVYNVSLVRHNIALEFIFC